MTSPPPDLAVTPVTKERITIAPELFGPMAWAIVYGGLKGGLAKTTSSWLSAIELARMTGEKVLVVCADPLSQTLTTAYRNALANGYDVPFTHIAWPTHEGFVKGVKAEKARVGARHVLVDVGGESAKILEKALILASELAAEDTDGNTSAEMIIPTAPNIGELWRLQSTFDAAANVEHLCPDPVGVNVLLAKARLASRKAKEARSEFARREWPVLRSQIPYQQFYEEALEWVPEDGGWYGSVLAELARERLEEDAA